MGSGTAAAWPRFSPESLLDARLCDLGLRIRGTPLERRLEKLDAQLESAGVKFRPHTWLSTDWFSPDGVPGFSIPFYLAHPKLARLERSQMLEVEGGTRDWCLKLMRHETAHALDNAYRLRRRRRWREVFGSPSRPYRATYVPRTSSRKFVMNLDNWYAQSHPVEDFAETFAVWLGQRSQWRKRYAGWPALRKLEYVDELMQEIRARPPLVRSRECVDSLPRLRMTLRQFYRAKKAQYGEEDRSLYDHDLLRLFSNDPSSRRRTSAATFLRKERRYLRRQIAKWTGQYQFVVDQVLKGMIIRCRDLRLHLAHGEQQTREGAVVLLTAHTTAYVRARHREYFR